jgi:hypothetical protein
MDQLSPPEPSWRNSTISEGQTIINEDGGNSIRSVDDHNARDFAKEGSLRETHSSSDRDGGNKSRDEDAITIASSAKGTIPRQQHDLFKHENLTATNTTVYSESKSLTNKNVQLWDHLSIVIGPPVILLLDLVVPCSIYYSWLTVERKKWRRNGEQGPKPVYNEHILGMSIISFGFGELYILIVRIVRLIKDREGCAPLLSRHWWDLDATCWVYGAALLIALIPFTVSTTARPEVIPWLYIFPPGFLMAFLALMAVITLIPINLPVRVNSDPRGSRMKPIVFYAAEDFIAVDGFQGRAFRKRFRARYDANPKFRRMILHLTLFWIGGICMYNGLLAAITWNLEFEYAFGTSLGVLFAWIGTWALSTLFWVRRVVVKEKLHAREEKIKRLSALMEDEKQVEVQ